MSFFPQSKLLDYVYTVSFLSVRVRVQLYFFRAAIYKASNILPLQNRQTLVQKYLLAVFEKMLLVAPHANAAGMTPVLSWY